MDAVWEIQITLTYPIKGEDIREVHTGDAEADFSRRSLERVRKHLEQLLKDSPFTHYHIIKQPVKRWE